MRLLKILVIAMGILIVVGMGVVAVTIVNRGAKPAVGTAVSSARVDIPAGSRIVETALDGERLVLRLALADGAEQLLVVDIATGRPVARVAVGNASSAPAK